MIPNVSYDMCDFGMRSMSAGLFLVCPLSQSCVSLSPPGIYRHYNTGFGIWDLPLKCSTRAKFGTLGLNWDFFGTIFIPFWDFYRYFHKNAAKLTKSKKGFKNRVVTTFNAKLPLFGDHFWAFIPNLHQMKTSIYLRSHLLTSTFQLA